MMSGYEHARNLISTGVLVSALSLALLLDTAFCFQVLPSPLRPDVSRIRNTNGQVDRVSSKINVGVRHSLHPHHPLLLSAHSELQDVSLLEESHSPVSRGSSRFSRRGFVAGACVTSYLLPVAAAGPPPGVESRRVAGIGGGVDVLTTTPPAAADVIYPASMLGFWQCQRIIVSVEGDLGQAEVAWRAMGGSSEGAFSNKQPETFPTRFIDAPPGIPSTYPFEGQSLKGVVLDRAFEVKARTRSPAPPVWDVAKPDVLKYEVQLRAKEKSSAAELVVIQRSIELPSEKGFGSNEFVRITTPASSLFGANSNLDRAIRVQRRFRRAFDKDGGRIVEGLEIVKTYRVLDGIAGAEMPTSTTKSQIRLSRPSSG